MNRPGTFQGASVCPRCGRTFKCGMAAGEGKCWCAELPPVTLPESGAGGCYCPDCLRQIAAAKADQPR